MNYRHYREFFRALGNETRLAIVQLLRNRPHYVNEIVESLGIEQSRISHNLACLLNCGFVEWEWSGRNKIYRLNSDLSPVLTGIEKHIARYSKSLDACQTLQRESQPLVVIRRKADPEPPQRGKGGIRSEK